MLSEHSTSTLDTLSLRNIIFTLIRLVKVPTEFTHWSSNPTYTKTTFEGEPSGFVLRLSAKTCNSLIIRSMGLKILLSE